MPGLSPIGQRVSVVGAANREMQVVGVVKDAVYETLRDAPPPTVYAQYFQGSGGVTLVLYAPGAVAPVVSAIRAEFQPKLAGKPVRVRTLTAQLESSLAQEQLMAAVASAFGALALVLAAVGLYGLLAYWVARRTHEIGIRMALGAPHAKVVTLVLGDALRMLAWGTALGVPIAWGLSRFVSSMLFGLTTRDAPTLAGAVALLTVTGLLAAWLPARRAANVNPLVALRAE